MSAREVVAIAAQVIVWWCIAVFVFAATWALVCYADDIRRAVRRRFVLWRARRTGSDARTVDVSRRRAQLASIARTGTDASGLRAVPTDVDRLGRPDSRAGGAR